MNKALIIIGGGGHARVLADLLAQCQRQVRGYTDLSETSLSSSVSYLGTDEALVQLQPTEVELVNGVGSTSDTSVRAKIFEIYQAKGFRFATLVHPSAILPLKYQLGEGSQVMAGAVIQTGVEIAVNSIVNTRASIDHDCQLGAHVHVAPGVTLSGGVVVGDRAHIGTGASVIQGIRIGSGAIVGAGATVTRDVADRTVIKGIH
ncbi:acetyltransferase [bacterium]|nr:acetyltransferase [bacterium]